MVGKGNTSRGGSRKQKRRLTPPSRGQPFRYVSATLLFVEPTTGRVPGTTDPKHCDWWQSEKIENQSVRFRYAAAYWSHEMQTSRKPSHVDSIQLRVRTAL